MTFEIAWVFGVAAVALVLFVTEWIRMDQVAITVPVLLIAGGVIDVEVAVSGLSNPATVTVAAMIVLGLGLEKTELVSRLGRWAAGIKVGSPTLRVLILCLVVASLSPFLTNTAVVVVFIPVFLSLARSAGDPPSRYLMPLSFTAILGGTVTLIGTSTNLIVHNLARNRGFDELSLFSIAPLGLIYLAFGMVYLFTIGRWLLPAREAVESLEGKIERRVFTTELALSDSSPLIGKPLDADALMRTHGLGGVELVRSWHWWPQSEERRLQPGDRLHVSGEASAIFRVARAERLDTPLARRRRSLEMGDDTRIIELVVAPGSRLAGHSLQELRFSSRFGAVVIGVQHPRRPFGSRLSQQRLVVGDLLLVQGPPDALERLIEDPGLTAIAEVKRPDPSRPPELLAAAILAAVVVAASLGVRIETAALIGAVGMVATRCLRIDEVYNEMDWKVLALLAGLLPLGVALDQSGGARLLATALAGALENAHPALVILCFYGVTSLLTEIMSNQATAVMLTPIALSTAGSLDMNPYALVVAVMFGASASFMTPMGYQTNALIYGPGDYRFSDYLRVGGLLNLILAGVAALVIPMMWP